MSTADDPDDDALDDDFEPPADSAKAEREEEVRAEVDEIESRDYSAYEVAKQAKPMEWLVQDLIPARGQIVLAGPAKLGRKSLLAHWLIMCVSEGKPFLGFQTFRRNCIYCHLEGGFERAARRWAQFGEGKVEPLEQDANAKILRFGIPGYERTLDALRQEQVLVIADPLVRVTAHRCVNENDPTEVTRFLYEHEELVNVGLGSVLFWLHHFRKAGDRMRGSTAYEAAVDGWFESFPTDDPAVQRIEITLRDGAPKILGARFIVLADGSFAFEACDPPAKKSIDAPSRLKSSRLLKKNGEEKDESKGPYGTDVDKLRLAFAEAGPPPEGGWRFEPNEKKGIYLHQTVAGFAAQRGLSRRKARAALEVLRGKGEVDVGPKGTSVPTENIRKWYETQQSLGLVKKNDENDE